RDFVLRQGGPSEPPDAEGREKTRVDRPTHLVARACNTGGTATRSPVSGPFGARVLVAHRRRQRRCEGGGPMAEPKRLPNGRWQIRYRDPQGRLRSKVCDTKAEARNYAQDEGQSGHGSI